MGVELYNEFMYYMIFNTVKYLFLDLRFESSVKSYDTKTNKPIIAPDNCLRVV